MASLFGACAAAALPDEGTHRPRSAGGDLLHLGPRDRTLVLTLQTLVLSPAPVVFLALALPWFLAGRAAAPRLSRLLLHPRALPAVRHEGRETARARLLLRAGLSARVSCPALAFFLRGFWRALRASDPGFFFFVWFAVVFVLLLASGSKLPPYLFPAIPAAAVLAARGLPARPAARGLWIVQALLATALAAGSSSVPGAARRGARAAARRHRRAAPRGPRPRLLGRRALRRPVHGARAGGGRHRLGLLLRRRRVRAGRKMPQARFTDGAGERPPAKPPRPRRRPIVGYRDYLNGVSWELKSPIPVAAYKGELEPEFETDADVRDALFWTRERFWETWRSGRPVVALVRMKDLVEMMTAISAAPASCAGAEARDRGEFLRGQS